MAETRSSTVIDSPAEGAAEKRVEPRVRPIRGGFLALTPSGVWPRIGVDGTTEQEAREAFFRSFASWESILAEAAGPTTPAD